LPLIGGASSSSSVIDSAADRRRRGGGGGWQQHRHKLKKSSSLSDFDYHQAVGGLSLNEPTAATAAAVGPRSLSSFQLPLTTTAAAMSHSEPSSASSSHSSRHGRQAALPPSQQQQWPPLDETSGGGGGTAAVGPSSSSRYSSRRSISNSFETVVGAGVRGASSGKDSLGNDWHVFFLQNFSFFSMSNKTKKCQFPSYLNLYCREGI
jgi:hypothetical protein